MRVNAVAPPGFIETPTAGMQGQDVRRALRLRIPLGRWPDEEVAATVVFLAGDGGSYYVGETLSPNGGIVTV